MSLLKTSVSPEMLSWRLDEVCIAVSRRVEQNAENLNHPGVGTVVYKAVQHKTDSLVAFAMQFAIKTILKPAEAQAVLDRLTLVTLLGGPETEHYWQRFNDIPKDLGNWSRGGVEPIMAGNAFVETCGDTGIQNANDVIRRFGADVFREIFEVTKRELKSVRLYFRP